MPSSSLLLCLLLCLLTIYLYSAKVLTDQTNDQRRHLLTFVRLLFVVLVFWLSFKPSYRDQKSVPIQNRLVILMDDSASMTLDMDSNKDAAQGKETRAGFVGKKIFGQEGLLSQFGKRGWLTEVRSLSTGALLTDAPKDQPQGPVTALGEGLRKVLKTVEDRDVEKILLIGDGCNNEGEDPVSIAAAGGVPVWTLGVGSENMPPDLVLSDLSAPEQVFKDESVKIRVDAQASPGIAEATVALESDGQVIQSGVVSLKQGSGSIEFEARFSKEGTVQIRAALPPLDRESVTTNNSVTRSIRVSKSQRKGLVLWGKPNWEFRFLVSALREDKRLLVDTLCALDKQRTLQVTSGEVLEDLGVRTSSKTRNVSIGDIISERIGSGVDWILLGDLPADLLGSVAMRKLETWVSESGGQFFCTGGPNSFASGGYAGTPLESLLPFRISNSPDFVEGQPTLELTEAGAKHLPFAASLGSSALLPVKGYNRLGEAKPGTIFLFSLKQDTESIPAMGVGRFGLGRVLAFSGSGTWSWQMYQKRGENDPQRPSINHGAFWRAVVNYFESETSAGALGIETDKARYEQGQKADVWFFYPSSLEGVSAESELHIEASDPDGEIDSISLGLRGAKSGLYSGSYLLKKAGNYRLKFALGTNVFDREISVEAPRREFTRLTQDADLLRSIAQSSGGEYVRAEDSNSLPERLPKATKKRTQTAWVLWGQKPWVIPLLLGILGLEWTLRRRAGLP